VTNCPFWVEDILLILQGLAKFYYQNWVVWEKEELDAQNDLIFRKAAGLCFAGTGLFLKL